jgi:hypothetical protein
MPSLLLSCHTWTDGRTASHKEAKMQSFAAFGAKTMVITQQAV